MNSSFLNIKTPQKLSISIKEKVYLDSSEKSDKGRFSPSEKMKRLLEGLNRVHYFQFHKKVALVDLKEIPLFTRKLNNDLGHFFQAESPDIPDLIHTLESIALTEGYFTSFLKHFISEDFSTPEEYSFSIITVLNYMYSYSISLEEALLEIFQLAPYDSVCELCIEVSGKDNKQLVSNHFNLLLLQRKVSEQQEDADSYDDADYKQFSVCSSDSSNNKLIENDEDVFSFRSDSDPNIFKPFNPFRANSTKESAPHLPSNISELDENLNSTMTFNPFSKLVTDEIIVSSPATDCPHCVKTFKTNYNMKQHIISVHKVDVPGMKMFRCPVKNCQFVTGSRVQYSRHKHEDTRVKNQNFKPVCNYCNEIFSNDSSLKRHLKRLHSS